MSIISNITGIQPFIANGDPTRSQMSVQQGKQSTTLQYGEAPLIRSGCESDLLHSNTLFIAKNDGNVIFKNNKIFVVKYVNDVIDYYYVTQYNRILKTNNFKKNDILIDSISHKNGILTTGLNLFTAIRGYKGWNYQDGIVISESASKKLASYHINKVEIFIDEDEILIPVNGKFVPSMGTKFKKGDIIYKKQKLSYNNKKTLYKEPHIEFSDNEYEVTGIEIYPGKINSVNRKYELVMKKLLIDYSTRREKIREDLKNKKVSDNDIEKILYMAKYPKENSRFKLTNNKKFEGTYIKLELTHIDSAVVGDKLANRHGNKGIITKIVPDDEMLRTVDYDGIEKPIELILNPMGLISRMNISQIFELSLAYSLKKIIFDLKKIEDISKRKEILLNYIKMIDRTKNNWYFKQTYYQFEKIDLTDEFLDTMFFLEPAFESSKIEDIYNLMNTVNVKSEYPVFDPLTKRSSNCGVGYIYTYKLVHMVAKKVSSRSVGSYINKTMQPVKGRSQGGGQRFGEMECWGLLAYEALKNLKETLTLKSDQPNMKKLYINDVFTLPENEEYSLNVPKNTNTETINLLLAYFLSMGIEISDLNIDDNFVSDVIDEEEENIKGEISDDNEIFDDSENDDEISIDESDESGDENDIE